MSAPTLASTATGSERTERLLNLSDGVFAIAITFLALDLGEIPETLGVSVSSADFVFQNVGHYAVYIACFAVVGFIWLRHHLVFRYVKDRTAVITWLNAVLLMLVAALPFPASILGDTGRLGLALLLILAPMATIALILWIIWEYARWKNLAISSDDPTTTAYLRATLVTSPIVLSVACLLAVINWLTGVEAWWWAAVASVLMLWVLHWLVARKWPAPRPVDVSASSLKGHVQSLKERSDKAVRDLSLVKKLRNGSDAARLIVFTDAVVAIAVTILALQLKAPSGVEFTNESLLELLWALPWWSYILTFLLITLFWLGHVHLFEDVKVADPILLNLNLLFLMFLAFLPIPTEMVGKDQGRDTGALVFYLFCLGLTSMPLAFMNLHARLGQRLTTSTRISGSTVELYVAGLWLAVGFFVAALLIALTGNGFWGNVATAAILMRRRGLRLIFGKAAVDDESG